MALSSAVRYAAAIISVSMPASRSAVTWRDRSRKAVLTNADRANCAPEPWYYFMRTQTAGEPKQRAKLTSGRAAPYPNTRRPAFQVPSTRPSSARPSNGVFCALPASAPASTCQARSG